MSPEEARRIRSRANSKCYYESHKDAVQTRVREHAHGKRRQLDDALAEIREAAALILKGADALAAVLKTLSAPRVSSSEETSQP
jgi:hypothetical protein